MAERDGCCPMLPDCPVPVNRISKPMTWSGISAREFLELQLTSSRMLSLTAKLARFAAAVQGPDFEHLPARCKFLAMMPQWDFLTFLSERAKKFPSFDLRMEHEGVDLIRNGERITGVLAQRPGQQPLVMRANLVIGCDGRHSKARGPL